MRTNESRPLGQAQRAILGSLVRMGGQAPSQLSIIHGTYLCAHRRAWGYRPFDSLSARGLIAFGIGRGNASSVTITSKGHEALYR